MPVTETETRDVFDIATLAGGCFWCTEAVFDRLRGVESVESGYTGGDIFDPDYEQVCSGTTGHAEAIRIRFDPEVISYDTLLEIFFATHDPTQLNRQGNDVGTQYRSAIFPHSPQQEAAAHAAKRRAAADWPAPIVTTIEPEGPWWKAEDVHQQYYDRVGDRNPYCSVIITPKVRKLMAMYKDRLKQPG
ncbi:MAG: peptide-methionine (S)-S-oxide reductase MsrA [Sphingomonadaceae bacterium]